MDVRERNRRIVMEVDYQVRLARSRGLKVKELARHVHRNPNFLCIMRQQQRLSEEVLLAILDYLGIPLHLFYFVAIHPYAVSPLWQFTREANLCQVRIPPQLREALRRVDLGHLIDTCSPAMVHDYRELHEIDHLANRHWSLAVPEDVLHGLAELDAKRFSTPKQVAAQAVEMLEKLGRNLSGCDRAFVVVKALSTLGSAHQFLGQLELAHKILSLAVRLGLRYSFSELLGHLALRAKAVLLLCNRTRLAENLVYEARCLFRQTGLEVWAKKTLIAEGVCSYLSGSVSRASVAYEKALASLPHNEIPHRIAALQGLAMVRLSQGQYKVALGYAKQARELASNKDMLTSGLILWLYANIAREASLVKEASNAYRETYRLLKSIPVPFEEVAVLLDWLLLCVENGLHLEASEVAAALAPHSNQLKRWKALRARIEDVVCAVHLNRLSSALLRAARAEHKKISRSHRWWPAQTLLQLA